MSQSAISPHVLRYDAFSPDARPTGWPVEMVSARDYDRLYAAARRVVAAAGAGYVYEEHPAILDLEAALDGEI